MKEIAKRSPKYTRKWTGARYEERRWYACPECGEAAHAPINPVVICTKCGARCRRATFAGHLKPKRKQTNKATSAKTRTRTRTRI